VALVGDTVTDTTGAGWMVTLAEAVFVASATEVAVTAKPPVVVPAVNNPPLDTVPPVAVQVTPVFELPVTVAENCRVCPGCKVTLVGDTEICTLGAACTVTAAVPDLLESATEVAVTVKLPGVAPAVKTPPADIVPPVAVQVTEVLEDPVTEAVNVCWPPESTVAVAGATVTLTAGAPEATTTVNFGRMLCVPAVLIGLIMSPSMLLTSMIP
jgi:hypothetical protein